LAVMQQITRRSASKRRRRSSKVISSKTSAQVEQSIVARLRKLSQQVRDSEDERLRMHIEQGNCIMDAADPIRVAGGIERWLAKHHLDLGVNGESRTTATNLVKLARAGYEHCGKVLTWAARNRDRLKTNRASGLDYFVAALRAYACRDQYPEAPAKRRKKRDRERLLLMKLARRDDWLHRLITELEKACGRTGWNSRVLDSIRAEMNQEPATAATDTPVSV
jgi:hypothetical protein